MMLQEPERFERRRYDPAVRQLSEYIRHTHDCVEKLKVMAEENKQTLQDMRDILASFRVLGLMARWIAGLAAAGTAIVVFWRSLKGE